MFLICGMNSFAIMLGPWSNPAPFEKKYLLGTSIARPVIAKHLVEVALKENADAICHGATGRGNDQVRFELGIKALAPQLQVIAPWREWNIKSREDAIDFASAHYIPVPVTKKKDYSMDWNIWHLSHEGSDLEDPANEPNPDIYILSGTPEGAPDKDEYVELNLLKGFQSPSMARRWNRWNFSPPLTKSASATALGLLTWWKTGWLA